MSIGSEVTELRSGASFIRLGARRLEVGSERFQRAWRVGIDGHLLAESFLDRVTGAEWLQPPTGLARPAGGVDYTLELCAAPAPSAVSADALAAELTVTGETTAVTYLLQVFPDAGGVRMRMRLTGGAASAAPSAAAMAQSGPAGLELEPPPEPAAGEANRLWGERDVMEALTLTPLHLRLTQVTLLDQTDDHNELVFEREWLLHTSECPLSLTGCLFYVEDVLTGAGLIFLKESPLPHARPGDSPADLRVVPAERRFSLISHSTDEADGDAFVTLAYDGGHWGRIAALQRYQRCLRPYAPDRDGLLLANTWGDRNRDGRINTAFMAQEIEAGARLGVDVIQVDDGWQAGTTSNSVAAEALGGAWEGFYAARDDFWAINAERFPDGLAPLVAAAREQGMRFGLWFAPDSTDDFANWRRDTATVLRLHVELGICCFKIDGVKLRSRAGKRNLRRFFDAVLRESAGRVVFDLDVTAETRPGYFGLMDAGPLFLENRYTDWRRYWPHQTLRNLWKLAHHVDPLRLRMEWLNNARNQEKYAGDPLAPACYRTDYLFATVMFSSPLGWFEVSTLPASYFRDAAPLIAVWKRHREALFAGTILPLGDAPDGTAWTGFLSLTADGSGAYLLLFREHNRCAEWSAPVSCLPDVPQRVDAALLSGEGAAALLPGRVLRANIDQGQRFLFAYLTFMPSSCDGRIVKAA